MAADDALSLATVTGYVIGKRRHLEEKGRMLYYFHTTAVDYPLGTAGGVLHSGTSNGDRSSGGVYGGGGVTAAAWDFRSANGGSRHWRNEFSVNAHGFVSSAGYRYRFDGWYDELYLYPTDGDTLDPVPAEWLLSMEGASAACEVRLLCYAFQPWFDSPFHALKYLAYPERNVCYSVWLCHRCLSPFFSQQHLTTHLEGYCTMYDPPGVVVYADPRSGVEVRYVDGGQHLHYCRCLSLLGKCFIESKVLHNDTDIYEYFTLTLPRSAQPFFANGAFASEERFRESAAAFDAAGWSGRVVAGYFSRLKHTPHHTLSCILTLPMFQHLRLGFFMLDAAYTLMAERQRQCGCLSFCGAAAHDGGAISRPLSPQGQVLLCSYWRRALLRVLWPRRHEDSQESGIDSVKALAAAMDIPIAMDDLLFLLVNSDFTFYAQSEAEEGEKEKGGAQPKKARGCGHDYQLSLVFDHSKVEEAFASQLTQEPNGHGPGTRVAAYFRPECMSRDRSGQLVYSKPLFHH